MIHAETPFNHNLDPSNPSTHTHTYTHTQISILTLLCLMLFAESADGVTTVFD